MISKIFRDDTTLYLVTDKISSPEILGQNFPYLKKRMVVEAFSYDDYSALRSEGYFRVLYSRLAVDYYKSVKKHLLFHYLNSGYKIEWIATHAGAFNSGIYIYRAIDLVADFNLAIYTINNLEEIPQEDYDRTRMIYTDRIKPE